MYESGFASREDIDRGMVLGCAHPMGPLALADLIGLDTLQAVAVSLYEEFRDPAAEAPSVLHRMVEAGLFARYTRAGLLGQSSHRSASIRPTRPPSPPGTSRRAASF